MRLAPLYEKYVHGQYHHVRLLFKVGDLTSFEAASMKALVPVTIIIAVVGVVATVMDMINKIGDQKGAPFGCSSN